MTVIRRGQIRPVSDLPLSTAASLVEVEDADGSARRLPVGALGGSGYPDSDFGTPNANDEEWEGAASITDRGWTIAANNFVASPTIDNPWSPSRFMVQKDQSDATTRTLILTRPLVGLGTNPDLSVTYDVWTGAQSVISTFRVGFWRPSSYLATFATVFSSGGNVASQVGQFTAPDTAASITNTVLQGGGRPGRTYVHLVRRWNQTIRAFMSNDGASWYQMGNTALGSPDVIAYTHLWVRVSIAATAGGQFTRFGNDWIRVNRFFLP
jgi:hypothetical protein